ncbi:MAG: diaminopimelate decarboxylase, partial [Bacteroidetes bacterium]|nr:diaminopimelate decarboxylase [Bacteroidota bacterium]
MKTIKKTYERPLIRPLNSGVTNKFGKRTEWSPFTNINGANIQDLIKEFGSPLFVYSEAKIRENYK